MVELNLETIRSHLRGVILDYSKYSGLSYEDITKLVRKGQELSSNEWKYTVVTGSDEEILRFYAQSKNYIFETLQPYLEPEKYAKDLNYLRILSFARKILRNKGHCRVLDFGGGVGELSILLAKIGCEVTYADLPGIMMEFAKWRFNEHNLCIKLIPSRIDGIKLPTNYYDLIVSDAVIEHLKQKYLENFIRAFVSALVNDGYIYILWGPSYTEKYPYHILGLGIKELDSILRRHHLIKFSDHLYVKFRIEALMRNLLWKFACMCLAHNKEVYARFLNFLENVI